MRAPRTRTWAVATISLLLISLSSCGFFAAGQSPHTALFSLTQGQLQRIMNAAFPIESEQEALAVAFSQPAVALVTGAHRITFAVDVVVSVVLEPGEGLAARRAQERVSERLAESAASRDPELLSGRIAVSTGIRFDADGDALFLGDVRIERLDVEQLPGRFRDPVMRLSLGAIGRAFQTRPIFELGKSSIGGSVAGGELRNVVVEKGALKITMAAGRE